MPDDYSQRLQPWIVVEHWWCEDNVCDCHQIQVSLRTPNHRAGKPCVCRSSVWEGGFFSEPDAEQMGFLEEELAEAKQKWCAGGTRRQATPEEAKRYINTFAAESLDGKELRYA